MAPRLPDADQTGNAPLVRRGVSRFPRKKHACVPGSSTTPGRPSACVGALGHIAFHYTDSVGTRDQFSIAAQWLACTFPCRRFADILTDACARLGADVVRYSFIVVDLHHLLLAGLPAHPCENSNARRARRNILDKLRFIRTYNTPDIRLDAMLENYIFYISRMYEFSHSLGPKRTNRR